MKNVLLLILILNLSCTNLSSTKDLDKKSIIDSVKNALEKQKIIDSVNNSYNRPNDEQMIYESKKEAWINRKGVLEDEYAHLMDRLSFANRNLEKIGKFKLLRTKSQKEEEIEKQEQIIREIQAQLDAIDLEINRNDSKFKTTIK